MGLAQAQRNGMEGLGWILHTLTVSSAACRLFARVEGGKSRTRVLAYTSAIREATAAAGGYGCVLAFLLVRWGLLVFWM